MGLLDKISSAASSAVRTVREVASDAVETVKKAEQAVEQKYHDTFDSKPPPTLPSAPPAAPTSGPTFKPSELPGPEAAAPAAAPNPLELNVDGGKRTEILNDPTLKRDMPQLLKDKKFKAMGAVSPEVAKFAKGALGEFQAKYPGGEAKKVAENKSGIIYFKDSKGQMYAAVLERHQHKNATEYGGPGKNGELLKPHNGVTIYKVAEQHPLDPPAP